MTYTLEELQKKTDKYGDLDLSGTAITALPDNLTVGGSLDLSGTAITALPDNLTVGGNLELRYTKITALPDNLTVGGNLYLYGTAITALPDNLAVGGNLDLRYTKITALPDNLAVGGNLDLRVTAITALPDNLTVGGNLELCSTAITALPDNLKIAGDIYSKGIALPPNAKLQQGDYVPGRYLYADGILTHAKRRRAIKGYNYYVGKIPGRNVIEKDGVYAHCKTFSEGVKELAFKTAKDREADVYRSLSPDSTVAKDDAITMYRIITGACKAGTEQFISTLPKVKATYTIREIIDITKHAYGSDTFKRFFNC